MSTEHEDYREDEELEDHGTRSIFAAGWFRAVLVLTVLAIAVVVALPYLLNWFEPTPAPTKGLARPSQNADAPKPASTVTMSPTQSAAPAAPAPSTGPQHSPVPASEKVQTLVPVPGLPRAASAAPVKPSSPTPQVAKADTPRAERPAVSPAKMDTRAGTAGAHWVQLGLFKDQKSADVLARKLRNQGVPIQVARVTRGESGAGSGGIPAGTYHVVRAGGFADLSAAIAARAALSSKGYSGFLTEGAAK